jgi:hypothetical protein
MGTRRNVRGPLLHAQLVQIGEVVFWDRTLPPNVDPVDTDEPYTVEMGDRHDLLAARKIQSSQWGWIVMERNRSEEDGEIDMRLWPNDFVPGATIMLPANDSIVGRGVSQ